MSERPPRASRPTDAARSSPFEGLPSLRVLWEQARAPDAARYEVDRLLRGLSLPLAPGEDARARADLLHLILDDPRLRAFRGSDGRRVEAVAARALVALGHPYALELAPESLEVMREDEREDRSFIIYDDAPAQAADGGSSESISSRQKVGWWLAIVAGMVEALLVMGSFGGKPERMLVGLVLILLTTFGSAFVAGSEAAMRSRALHYLSLLVAALPSLPWFAFAGLVYLMSGYKGAPRDAWFLVPLTVALARLSVPICLYRPRPKRKPSRLRAGRRGR